MCVYAQKYTTKHRCMLSFLVSGLVMGFLSLSKENEGFTRVHSGLFVV